MNRLASGLRLLSSAALLVAALAIFQQPLSMVLGPRLGPVVNTLEMESWLGGGSARGFMLQVTSLPQGAQVWVDGTLRTQTPAVANVPCRDGDPVTITLRHEGYADFERTLACREGGSLNMRIRLER